MQCFIIASKDSQKTQSYIKELLEKHAIAPIDIVTLEQQMLETTGKTKKNTQSLGIEDVRRMLQKLYLKPLQGEKKAIIIKDAPLLTIEAQNALLKTLEEPPPRTIIVLEVKSQEQLLPTIQSRCKIVVLNDEKKEISNSETEQFEALFGIYKHNSIPAKLKLAQDKSKQKDAALQWLETMLSCTREALLQSIHEKEKQTILLSLTKQLVNAHTTITTTNVSPRMTLENLLLS